MAVLGDAAADCDEAVATPPFDVNAKLLRPVGVGAGVGVGVAVVGVGVGVAVGVGLGIGVTVGVGVGVVPPLQASNSTILLYEAWALFITTLILAVVTGENINFVQTLLLFVIFPLGTVTQPEPL